MDDRELELRLTAHLHRRFDDAPLPSGLHAAVSQGLRTESTRLGFDLRTRRLTIGWSAVAAMLILVAGWLLYGGPRGHVAAPGATATPEASPTAAAEATRWFIVLPPTSAVPSKAASNLAADVLNARMSALRIGNFTGSAGYAIQLQLPAVGPSDASIRRILGANGDVEFVPLPAADYYGEGGIEATVGEPLPRDEPALFGWDGIASVATGTDQQGNPTLEVTLKPVAGSAFGDYTGAHIGEHFAILVDGKVVSVPVIQSAIPGGEVTISAGEPADSATEWGAILAGGLLPPEWRDPVVPVILQRQELAARVARDLNGATVDSADLDAILVGQHWTPVWRTQLGGPSAHSCPDLPADGSRTCPPIEGSVTYIFNAETAAFISAEPTP